MFQDAPALFDVVLTNPPFGGKEGKEAQTRFAYKTGATQVLFLQHVIDSLKPGGRCGIVLDEGVLFRTNETAFVQTKRKLLDDCDLWCIVSLPRRRLHQRRRGREDEPALLHQGQADRADLVLRPLRHQGRQEDPADRRPLRGVLPPAADARRSPRSWTVTREEIEARNYDLKAVNPNAKVEEDLRTPEELLDLIEQKGEEVKAALAKLRRN